MTDQPARRDVVDALLRVHGRTFAEEVGIDLDADDAAAVFCLLVAALLFSARIDHRLAARAARALFAQGWTDARSLADAGWQARTTTLNEAGYARYDESTARMLGDTCALALERYDGDLRRLRARADGDAAALEEALAEFTGIGAVGASIFVREVQAVWTELQPYVDDRVRDAAASLGLPRDTDGLVALAGGDVTRLTAALVRTAITDDPERVLAVARGEEPPPVDEQRMTAEELYERARQLDVPGRSKMDKQQLADAVRAEEGSADPDVRP